MSLAFRNRSLRAPRPLTLSPMAAEVRAGTLLTLDGAGVNVEQRGERGRIHATLRRASRSAS